jgi:hypothetical protein
MTDTPDRMAPDAEPTDLATALNELRHARAEVARLRPFVDMADNEQRDAEDAERSPAVRELAEALRLTREYVGEDLLPAVEGWSWYDALRRWAPAYLDDKPADTAAAEIDQIIPKPDQSNDVGPHHWQPKGWRCWICHHCYAPRTLHPRTAWVRARPLHDNQYLSANAPHFKGNW